MRLGVTRLVGVVVPAYNAEKWLAATLASLRAQTWSNWVCLIIDDGSSDATAAVAHEVVAGDERMRLIRQPNLGLPAARNVGIHALPEGCPYVAFLDSDDLYEPDALAVLVEALELRPDAVGAYGLADYIDENGDPVHPGLHPRRQQDRRAVHGWRLRDIPPDAEATFASIVAYGSIWPPAVALQRLDHVNAVGGFDPSFASQEDWEFYVRITRRGPYVTIPRRLAWYRRHSANLTGQHDLSSFQQERVRRKAYRSTENSALQVRQVARAWRYLEARQAAVLARHLLRCVAHGRWREAWISTVGTVICAALVLRPGPPRANARRVRYTRPASLPGNVMLPADS